MTTKYIAYAITTDQVEAMGAVDSTGIQIMSYIVEEGTQVYTGEDIYLDTDDLADTDDMDAALTAAGWHTTGQGWVESAGQWIAEVEPLGAQSISATECERVISEAL